MSSLLVPCEAMNLFTVFILAFAVCTLNLVEESLADYESHGIECLTMIIHGRVEKGFKGAQNHEWQSIRCKDKHVFYCDRILNQLQQLFCREVCCLKFYRSTPMPLKSAVSVVDATSGKLF